MISELIAIEMGILIAQGVRKTFGGLVAVNDVSIDVKKGSFSVLIGPNGSGKTTLINVLSGFYKADRGRIWFNGKEITKLPPEKRYMLGLARTYQVPQLFDSLTVMENLLIAYKSHPGESFSNVLLKKKWIKSEEEAVKKASAILKTVKLDHLFDKLPSELSGGQLKLLEVGRALMSGAKMILMDEPAAGIFPALARELFAYFTSLKNKFNVTFLVVEHRLDLVMEWADYVYAMVGGKIVTEGSPEKVINDPILIEHYLGG